MAEIVEGGGGDKHGKKRPKKSSARIDMTPMVDLAFLLLTFFVLAATLAKPKAMEIIYPKEVDDQKDKTKLDDALATTLLLGEHEDEIFYYTGVFKPDSTELKVTTFGKDGFRKIMLEKNWRDLIKPKALDVDKETLSVGYGKFVAKPLERGFGLKIALPLVRFEGRADHWLLARLNRTAEDAVQ